MGKELDFEIRPDSEMDVKVLAALARISMAMDGLIKIAALLSEPK